MAGVVAPFAGAIDYENVYGLCQERERLDALLLRASGYVQARMPAPWEPGVDPVFDLNAATVCMAMVHRALSAPMGMEGVTQYTQTAGPYTASVSMADQYMRLLPSEAEALGLADGAVLCARMGA